MRLPCRWSTLTYLIRMYTHTHTHTASGALWHLRHQVCIYVCMYVCMYVYTHTHTPLHKLSETCAPSFIHVYMYIRVTSSPIHPFVKTQKRPTIEAKETHVLTKPRIHKEFVRSKDFVNLCPNFFYFTKTANPMVPPCTTLQKKIWSNHIVNCTCLDTFSCR